MLRSEREKEARNAAQNCAASFFLLSLCEKSPAKELFPPFLFVLLVFSLLSLFEKIQDQPVFSINLLAREFCVPVLKNAGYYTYI